jgi:mono/diheme cytochrome c family protein
MRPALRTSTSAELGRGGFSRRRSTLRRLKPPLHLLICLLFAMSCDDRDTGSDTMTDHGRIKPHEPTAFFADGNSSRPLLEGTVHRDAAFPAPPGDNFPFPITRKDLQRGQERYNIYCSVCHGFVGDGDGMIVRRGFTKPPSFHSDHMREHPPGHFVQVITNGFGAMYSYSDRVSMDDRWRIAAYIRALQLSQHADPKQLPPQDAGAAVGAASAAARGPQTRNTQ